MKRLSLLLLVLLALLAIPAIWIIRARRSTGEAPCPPPAPAATTPPPALSPPVSSPSDPVYSTGPASPDGTGKFYLGREISMVMGHRGIGWLERGTRESEEAPARAVAELALPADTIIADIGAGSGYYTFRLAPLVPEGKVIAVDIQPEMISFLKKRAQERGFTNIVPHLGTIENVQLPPASIDAALFVDAYHEFSHPYEMMTSIVRALRPGGRVFLLEYRAEDPEVPIKPLHKMSQAQAKKELEAAGLLWVRTGDFLPWQHFMVFKKG